MNYGEWLQLADDVQVHFTNTGHLPGAAAIHLIITEAAKDTRITYSGDVGRYRSLLLQPPAPFSQSDYLILESTYGNKHHDVTFDNVKTINQ